MAEIHLDEKLLDELEKIAGKKHREVGDILQEAVERYIEAEQDDEEFEAEVDEIMREQAWLLNELAKR